MSVSSLVTLFGAMAVLALVPSPSVFAVVARSLAAGFGQGALVALGITLGDIAFILAAVLGLAALADSLASLFTVVKYAGALYLVWLGVSLWRQPPQPLKSAVSGQVSGWSSLATGLLITLGDYKAILFYVGFLPAFLGNSVSWGEAGLTTVTALVAVGGAKLIYAYAAHRARGLLANPGAVQRMNRLAAAVMAITGVALLV